MAVWRRKPDGRATVHSDRVQVTRQEWQTFLRQHDPAHGMTRRGHCPLAAACACRAHRRCRDRLPTAGTGKAQTPRISKTRRRQDGTCSTTSRRATARNAHTRTPPPLTHAKHVLPAMADCEPRQPNLNKAHVKETRRTSSSSISRSSAANQLKSPMPRERPHLRTFTAQVKRLLGRCHSGNWQACFKASINIRIRLFRRRFALCTT